MLLVLNHYLATEQFQKEPNINCSKQNFLDSRPSVIFRMRAWRTTMLVGWRLCWEHDPQWHSCNCWGMSGRLQINFGLSVVLVWAVCRIWKSSLFPLPGLHNPWGGRELLKLCQRREKVPVKHRHNHRSSNVHNYNSATCWYISAA